MELSAIAVIAGAATALLAVVVLVPWLVIATLRGDNEGLIAKASVSGGPPGMVFPRGLSVR
jgi:hypothetical protein